MSLIPYHPREGREIVLRHHNAIVVRDPSSQRLEIRGLQLTECPTCHQPLRASSPDHHFDVPSSDHHDETYVNPDYFRMLRATGFGRATSSRADSRRRHHPHHAHPHHQHRHPPSSPIRRLVEPPVRAVRDAGEDEEDEEEEEEDDDEDAIADDEEEDEDYGDGSVSASLSVPVPLSTVHDEAEFVSSTPAVQEGSRIRREAFQPNYFNTFFIEERELGRGGKGVVLLVRHEIDGCHLGYFACKRVPVGDDHAWLEKVLVEVELLAKLSHPNLVSYRHVWLEDYRPNRFGPSVACAFILQQYCNGGDLLHYVIRDAPREATKEELKAQMRRRSKGQLERPQPGFLPGSRGLPFEEIYSLFRDITSGLCYLHAANYIHRDLKPSNCLLHREGKNLSCLISDFGEVQPENVVRKSTGSTGTISYCAPEVLRMDPVTGCYGNFTAKSDIFSLGMILYFMCFGRLPYQSANTVHEELEDIDLLRAEITDWKGFQDERRERPDLPWKLYQLLKRLLAVDPAERPTANEVLAVMKSESSLSGLDSGARSGGAGVGVNSGSGGSRSASPSIGMTGSRIQNLDSPMAPGTPVPDPTKQTKPAPFQSEDDHRPRTPDRSPQHIQRNSLQKRATPDLGAARHRGISHRHSNSHSIVLSRSQDRYPRSGSRSPDRSTLSSTAASTATMNILRRNSPAPGAGSQALMPPPPASETPNHSDAAHFGGALSPPLLMPPPTTPLAQLRHAAQLAQYRVGHLLLAHGAALGAAARLALFLTKMLSLSYLCWPYGFSPGVGAALVAIAGLDLGVPAAVAGAGVRTGGATRHWAWSWRASMGLLVLHFVALLAAMRLGALCAASAVMRGGWAIAGEW